MVVESIMLLSAKSECLVNGLDQTAGGLHLTRNKTITAPVSPALHEAPTSFRPF